MPIILKETFTIVGLYEDTNQSYARKIDAPTVEAAFDIAARAAYPELLIIGAVGSDGYLTPPDQDGGKTARAIDLILDDEV